MSGDEIKILDSCPALGRVTAWKCGQLLSQQNWKPVCDLLSRLKLRKYIYIFVYITENTRYNVTPNFCVF